MKRFTHRLAEQDWIAGSKRDVSRVIRARLKALTQREITDDLHIDYRPKARASFKPVVPSRKQLAMEAALQAINAAIISSATDEKAKAPVVRMPVIGRAEWEADVLVQYSKAGKCEAVMPMRVRASCAL